MPAAVEIEDVSKVFRTWNGEEFPALRGVSLEVPAGRLVGFLGPNGAGKTTLMRTIHAFWPPTSGRLRVLGLDPGTQGRELKARLGVAPQENNLDPDFKVERNLTTYARYFRMPSPEARRKAKELLAFVGLSEKARSEVESLSGGMKRRLVLARALLNDPDLLLLDEPTTGLDPQARHLVWQKIRDLRKHGKTILLTTHYMEEAELLCDEIVIMNEGRVHVRGTPADLIAKHASKEVLELVFSPGNVPTREAIAKVPGFDAAEVDLVGDRAFVYAANVEELLHEAKARLAVTETRTRRGGLEDVFLRVTGRDLRE